MRCISQSSCVLVVGAASLGVYSPMAKLIPSNTNTAGYWLSSSPHPEFPRTAGSHLASLPSLADSGSNTHACWLSRLQSSTRVASYCSRPRQPNNCNSVFDKQAVISRFFLQYCRTNHRPQPTSSTRQPCRNPSPLGSRGTLPYSAQGSGHTTSNGCSAAWQTARSPA